MKGAASKGSPAKGKGLKCGAVIFQFNSKAILFEFEHPDGEQIGVVRPQCVTVEGKPIPETVKTVEGLCKYIGVGDEITCSVYKSNDLEEFIYNETEEEIDEDEKVKVTNREVKIKPVWYTPMATVTKRCSAEDEEDDEIGLLDVEDCIGEIGDQLGDYFAPDEKAKKKAKPKEKTPEPEEDLNFKAKVVGLKKPQRGNEKSKITCGFMELLDGKYAGRRIVFQNSCVFVWGHHLIKANLMYNVKYGDEYEVELAVHQDNITVRKAFLGGKVTKPIKAVNEKEFAVWLANRSLDEEAFKKWIDNRLPPKPFFPLQSEIHEAEFVSWFDKTQECDGGILKICSSGDLDGKYVMFEREDFYFFGVSVGNADLRLLVRPSDRVSCQINAMSNAEKKKFKKCFPDGMEVEHMAYLVYTGTKRPRSATLRPYESMELKAFLESLGLTLQDFEAMREPAKGKTEEKKEEKEEGKDNQGKPNPVMPHFMNMSQQFPSYLQGPLFGEGPMVNSLANRAMALKTIDNPRIKVLFENETDIHHAIILTKILTQALLIQMQSKMKMKLEAQFGGNLQAILEGQKIQVEAAEKNLKESQREAQNANRAQSKEKPIAKNSPPKENIAQKLKEIEEKEKNEASKKGSRFPKSKIDMKKRLQSFKAEKMPQPVRASKTPPKMTKKELAQKKKRNEQKIDPMNMTPLELLRHYAMNEKTISMAGEMIWFDDVGYHRDIKTNFKITRRLNMEDEFYTLHTLYHFWLNSEMDHSTYLKVALEESVPSVRAQDRRDLLAYLSGKESRPKNLTNKTHRELNPHLFEAQTQSAGGEYGGGNAIPQAPKLPDPVALGNVEEWKNKYLRPGGAKRALSQPRQDRSRSPTRRSGFDDRRGRGDGPNPWESKSNEIISYPVGIERPGVFEPKPNRVAYPILNEDRGFSGGNIQPRLPELMDREVNIQPRLPESLNLDFSRKGQLDEAPFPKRSRFDIPGPIGGDSFSRPGLIQPSLDQRQDPFDRMRPEPEFRPPPGSDFRSSDRDRLGAEFPPPGDRNHRRSFSPPRNSDLFRSSLGRTGQDFPSRSLDQPGQDFPSRGLDRQKLEFSLPLMGRQEDPGRSRSVDSVMPDNEYSSRSLDRPEISALLDRSRHDFPSRGIDRPGHDFSSRSIDRSRQDFSSRNMDRPGQDFSRNMDRPSQDFSSRRSMDRPGQDFSRNMDRPGNDFLPRNMDRPGPDVSRNIDRPGQDFSSRNMDRPDFPSRDSDLRGSMFDRESRSSKEAVTKYDPLDPTASSPPPSGGGWMNMKRLDDLWNKKDMKPTTSDPRPWRGEPDDPWKKKEDLWKSSDRWKSDKSSVDPWGKSSQVDDRFDQKSSDPWKQSSSMSSSRPNDQMWQQQRGDFGGRSAFDSNQMYSQQQEGSSGLKGFSSSFSSNQWRL